LKKSNNRILSGLSESTELPLAELCSKYRVSVNGKYEVTVDGVLSVLEYGEEKIMLELCDRTVTLYGSMLEMKSYYRGSMVISGEIIRIEYGDEKCQ